jgi:hypothetical protein
VPWLLLILAHGDQLPLLRSHPPTLTVEWIKRLHFWEDDGEKLCGEQRIGTTADNVASPSPAAYLVIGHS